jgi:hypothetical protein
MSSPASVPDERTKAIVKSLANSEGLGHPTGGVRVTFKGRGPRIKSLRGPRLRPQRPLGFQASTARILSAAGDCCGQVGANAAAIQARLYLHSVGAKRAGTVPAFGACIAGFRVVAVVFEVD